MLLLRILLLPISFLYGRIVAFRNKLFDWKILKSEKFDIPIISVGNITVGGTGKSPQVHYLMDLLRKQYKVATVSRGYKRKTKGFVEVTAQSTVDEVGDEPKQFKLNFPDATVTVSEKLFLPGAAANACGRPRWSASGSPPTGRPRPI